MADMIARLKVDSSEYDSKIQRAAKGIQHLAEACHNAGAHLNVLEDENREYIQSLGNMATVATTARGKIAELTSAFIDIKSVYNSLSQEEKNGEFGKELNKQLDIMKGRIQEGKRELADINNEINGGGGLTGALDSLAGKFGMNIKQLAGWGTALAAAKGALDVAKDAFFANEQQLDEWGRTVQASESLYQGFLNALNNTDISGFLTRMDDIVSAAREAYNALDDLNTYSAFNQRNEMKERAGYTKALDEYKLNPTADNKKALADANKAVIDGLRETQQKTEDAYMAALRQIATERLNDKKLQAEFVKVFSEGGRNALADAKIGYSQGKMLNAGSQYWYGDRVYDGRIQDRSTGKWRDMSQQEKQNFEFARALSQVNDSQIKEVQALGRQSQAIADQIYQQDRAYNRMAGNNGKVGGSGGGGGRSGGNTKTGPTYDVGSLAEVQADVQRLTKLWNEAGADVRNQYLQPLIEAEQKVKDMQNAMTLAKEQTQGKLKGGWVMKTNLGGDTFANAIPDISKGLQLDNLPLAPLQQLNTELQHLRDILETAPNTEAYQTVLQAIADKEKEIANFKGMATLNKDAEKSAKSFQTAAGAVTSLGSALGSLDDPGAKIAATVAQAIANIALAFSNADLKEGESGNIWYWIAATAAGVATMVSTISSIHSSTGYAQGGLIKGNSYSGDNIGGIVDGSQLVGLNAGEVVLSASQQSMLASNLQGSGGKMEIVGVLSGENVVLMADRWGRRTGRGELLFGKNL